MKVPTYEERVKIGTPHIDPIQTPNVTMPRVIPDAFGANIGEATQNMGAAIGKIAGHIKQMAIDAQDKEVIKRETSFRMDLQNRLTNPEDETIQIGGQDVTRKKGLLLRPLGQAKGATVELDQAYETQIKKQYLGGLSQYQASKLSPAMDNYYMSTRNNVITHEANQLDEDFKNATESNIKQKIMDASLIRDDKQLVMAIDDARTTIAPYNRRYDKATQAIQNERVAKEIAESSILAAIEQTGNYLQAKTMLEGIKDKIAPATYTDLSNKIGQRAVDMAIAQDMSIRQDDSTVMKELQKGKQGIFGYLPTTELNKSIKESQQKIYYNSQIQVRQNKEFQEARNDDILSKINSQTITLADIQKEIEIPEEQGRLPLKTLLKYKEGIVKRIGNDLEWEIKQTTQGVPWGTKGVGKLTLTENAKKVTKYLNLINAFVDDKTDALYAMEILADAYKDGIVNRDEAPLLNGLRKNIKGIETIRKKEQPQSAIGTVLDVTTNMMPLVAAVKIMVSRMKGIGATEEELVINIKNLLGTASKGGNPIEASHKAIQDFTINKMPELSTAPEKGTLLMDAEGNLAMGYPDGRIEPYLETEKSEGAKYMEGQEKKK